MLLCKSLKILIGFLSLLQLRSWVQPSFGEIFGGSGLNTLPSTKGFSGESKSKARPSSAEVGGKKQRKRKGEPQTSNPEPGVFSSRRGSQDNQDEPWVDVHAPQTQVRRPHEPEYTSHEHIYMSYRGFSSSDLLRPSWRSTRRKLRKSRVG